MKRRAISVILSLILVLSLFGCANKDVSDEKKPVSEVSTETSVQTAAEPVSNETTPEPTVEPVVEYTGKTGTFDTETQYQTIDGFGAALTWYGERLMNAVDSEGAFDAAFEDAKWSILRFKNEYEYTIDGKAGNATAMARNYKEARDHAAKRGETVKVLLCCWSPPAKLKSDNTIDTGYGTLKKNDNGEYMYKEYADWWVDSIKYYQSKGIVIDYVCIQNELDFSPEDYEGCRFAAKETDTVAGFSEAFIAVYEAFKAAFGENAPKLLGPESMGCSPATLMSYLKPVQDKCPEALDGLAFHLYATGTSDSSTNTVKPISYMDAFTNMRDFYPGLRKWQTEFWIGRGIQTAELIWTAMTCADLNAYIFWSGVWDDSQPGKLESNHLIEVNSKGEWRTSANYYAIRHYSEFIRPGYVRIDMASDDAGVKVSAYTNEYKNKVAAVLINKTDKEKEYRLVGNGYTITDSAVYQSVFGDLAENVDDMYRSLGALGDGYTIMLPAKSVTTVDITGYYGDTAPDVPKVRPIVYPKGILDEPVKPEAPDKDTVIFKSDFSSAADVKGIRGFGSASVKHVADGGEDGTGCALVTGRSADWNGGLLQSGYFEYYGYLVKVSYDCMMTSGAPYLSLTSSFSVGSSTYYPDGENNRIDVSDLEPGKWYHVEGYSTLYSNMKDESFQMYWESPGNTDDIYIDNVEVTVLYTQPAGEYVKPEE